VPASAGAHGDETVDSQGERLLGVTNRDHVVEHAAPVRVHSVDDLLAHLEGRDDNGDAVSHARFEV